MKKTNRVTVHIRHEDLIDAPYSSTKFCPIGRALRRVFPDAHIIVGYDFLIIDNSDCLYFPKAMQKAKETLWDNNRHKFRPFYFRFNYPGTRIPQCQ